MVEDAAQAAESQSLLRQVCIRPGDIAVTPAEISLNPFFVRSAFVPGAFGRRFLVLRSQSLLRQVCIRPYTPKYVEPPRYVSIPSSSGLHSSLDTLRYAPQDFVSIPSSSGLHSSVVPMPTLPSSAVSIPSSSGLHSSGVSRWRGGVVSVSIPSSSGLHSSPTTATASSMSKGLNPFFVRSAFVPHHHKGLVEIYKSQSLLRQVCIRPKNESIPALLKCLNPFFVRSAFVQTTKLSPADLPSLNPFFVRSAFVHRPRHASTCV